MKLWICEVKEKKRSWLEKGWKKMFVHLKITPKIFV
jgi:hypothetical protein